MQKLKYSNLDLDFDLEFTFHRFGIEFKFLIGWISILKQFDTILIFKLDHFDKNKLIN